MRKLKLPIGIQTFEKMRDDGYAYVDKTAFVASLARDGTYFFLSRPRRFGKSLFVDTLDCAFAGRRELFTGLYLDSPESDWDWRRKHPVLRIDWSLSPPHSPQALTERIEELLALWAARWSFAQPKGTVGGRFEALVRHIAETGGEKVVVLVDEYDKPILDNLEDPKLATQLRDMLKDFYGALKPLDPWLRFVFLTGVSKFAKAGIFSGLNNLKDITVDARYSAICGYTQNDLETVFADRLEGLDLEAVRSWYNGYSWSGEAVYNPFDILLFLDERIFKAFWFETGTPSFLVKLLGEKPRSLPELEGLVVGQELLGSFRIEDLEPETLLFQAGYLTIKDVSSDSVRGTRYTLGFPNREVRQAFSALMLAFLTSGPADARGRLDRLYDIMDAGDTGALRALVHSFFASIPNDWYRKNRISEFEGYYASVVYAYFASVGYEVIPEDVTNRGRIDLTVKTQTGIWIFEFKVRGLDRSGDKSPLEQLRERGYAEKYRADGRTVRQVGIVFDPDTRNIEAWETE